MLTARAPETMRVNYLVDGEAGGGLSSLEGVLFSLGCSLKGVTAFVIGGELVVHYNSGFLTKHELRLPIQPRRQQLVIDHRAPGKLRGEATVSLVADGKTRASGEVNMSPAILHLNGEGLDIGLDRKTKVSAECEGRGAFAYPGQIEWLRIEPGAQAPDSMVNQAELAVQKDW